jgi:serine/threonine-protein kinase
MTALTYGKTETLMVMLDPGSQSEFLRQLGFIYNPQFKAAKPGETSPRILTDDEATVLKSDVTIVVRSDAAAGNGGLRGLPSSVLNRDTKLVILDDPATVTAFTDWQGDSANVMVQKLVPALAKVMPGS